jgi:hypothetical protein
MPGKRGYASFSGLPMEAIVQSILAAYSFDFVPATDNVTNAGSSTKRLKTVYCTGISNGTGILDVPSETTPGAVFVTTNNTQTLTGKTLTAPIISTISNTGTLTLPTSTDTLIGRATTDTLTNKTLTSPDINGGNITNSAIIVQNSIISTGSSPVVYQNSSHTTTVAFFPTTLAADKTVRIPSQSTSATDTVVLTDFAQTLINKTLTSPIISTISNTGTLTLPTSTQTLVGRTTTDTLTNKTLNGNTLASWIDGSGHTLTPEAVTGTIQVVSTTTGAFAPIAGPIAVLSGGNLTLTYTKYSDGTVKCLLPKLANIAQNSTTPFHSASATIPAGYRPTTESDSSGYLMVINNDGYNTPGGFSARSNGEIYIGADPSVADFLGTGNVGWPSQAIWWGTT